jgi:hypothetical protein
MVARFEISEARAEALQIEKKLKQLKSKIMLKRIIEGFYLKLARIESQHVRFTPFGREIASLSCNACKKCKHKRHK